MASSGISSVSPVSMDEGFNLIFSCLAYRLPFSPAYTSTLKHMFLICTLEYIVLHCRGKETSCADLYINWIQLLCNAFTFSVWLKKFCEEKQQVEFVSGRDLLFSKFSSTVNSAVNRILLCLHFCVLLVFFLCLDFYLAGFILGKIKCLLNLLMQRYEMAGSLVTLDKKGVTSI